MDKAIRADTDIFDDLVDQIAGLLYRADKLFNDLKDAGVNKYNNDFMQNPGNVFSRDGGLVDAIINSAKMDSELDNFKLRGELNDANKRIRDAKDTIDRADEIINANKMLVKKINIMGEMINYLEAINQLNSCFGHTPQYDHYLKILDGPGMGNFYLVHAHSAPVSVGLVNGVAYRLTKHGLKHMKDGIDGANT